MAGITTVGKFPAPPQERWQQRLLSCYAILYPDIRIKNNEKELQVFQEEKKKKTKLSSEQV
jgi:hypothetical protein